jgi:hypothetical protein
MRAEDRPFAAERPTPRTPRPAAAAVMLLAGHGRGIDVVERTAAGWSARVVLDDARVTCLAAQPEVVGRIYAGTRDRGVLRSDDRGETWRSAGMAGLTITSLATTRAAPDVVFAGTKPAGVFVSRDGGEHWRELEAFRSTRRWYWWSPAEPPDWRAYVMGLGVSPSDPDVVVAGIEFGGVVRSADGGRTWSTHRRHADLDCHALTFHHRDGGWVYEAGGGGPAVSRDGGDTWLHPLSGLSTRYSMAVAADAARPEVWYVTSAPLWTVRALLGGPVGHREGAACAAVYRSSGGGAWQRLAGGLPQPLDHPPYGLATDPERPGHVYLGLSHGVLWHSDDHGDTWRELPARARGVRRSLVVAP